MSLEAINNPRIVARKESSIVINWENVFPPMEDKSHLNIGCKQTQPPIVQPSNERIYDLRIQDDIHEWRIVYWGRRTQTTVSNLQPCRCYVFKIKLIHDENAQFDCGGEQRESHWLEFKAATSTDQYHVQHMTRAIKHAKTAAMRKIIAGRPYLLETPNLEDKTPLMQATECGDLHLVQFLCTLGAKPNAQSPFSKRTALMIALFYGHIDIAQYLLEKHADINLRDVNDRTALHYAIDGDHFAAVKFALRHGAEINSRDSKGWTPLLRAVILEVQDDVIKLLLRKGSDCSATDQRGLDFCKHLELTQRARLLPASTTVTQSSHSK